MEARGLSQVSTSGAPLIFLETWSLISLELMRLRLGWQPVPYLQHSDYIARCHHACCIQLRLEL